VILYLDTSSLVKLYINEADSEEIREVVAQAEMIVTCRITFPEFYSALTRRRNCNEISSKDYEKLCHAFESDWERISILDFDERRAGSLVRKHGLRGADSIHLSSLMQIAGVVEKLEVAFSSCDMKLNAAAVAEGFLLSPVNQGTP
jgi:predicted nucleic acid-binding protein